MPRKKVVKKAKLKRQKQTAKNKKNFAPVFVSTLQPESEIIHKINLCEEGRDNFLAKSISESVRQSKGQNYLEQTPVPQPIAQFANLDAPIKTPLKESQTRQIHLACSEDNKKPKLFTKAVLYSIFAGLILAGVFSVVLYVFAEPPTSKYTFGETLDPNCSPGDTNCSVDIPAQYSFSSNNFSGTGNITTTGTVTTGTLSIGSEYTFPTADGTNGQTLITNGSGVVTWSAVSSMTYPGAGVAVSTGSAWDTSLATANLSSLADLSYASTSFIKMTGANTFALDTTSYVTSGDLALYVPYIGATGAVDLGANNLTVDTNVFHVDSSGNKVGIGTTAPEGLLNLNSGVVPSYGQFLVEANNAGALSFFTYAVDNSGIYFDAVWAGDSYESRDAGSNFAIEKAEDILKFLYKSGIAVGASIDSWNAGIAINSSGNVGIGTTNPGALLDLGTAGTTQGVARFEGATSGYVGLAAPAEGDSTTYTLPATSANGFLLNTGGTLSWDTTSYVTSGDLALYVPYTGASNVLNLGAQNLTTAGTVNLGGLTAGKPVFTDGSKNLTSSGTLGVDQGGTGLTSGTSGGVIYYSASGTLASSSQLDQYKLIVGGGAGAAPVTIGSAGSANQVLLSGGASANPTWSTATYPATTTANQLLYSSATNTVAGLTSANSSVLVTNGSGVPSLSTTLPAVTLSNTITLGSSTGNTLSATSGVLTIAGVGNTNNENLTIDFEGTANTVAFGTGTGVTLLDFGSFNVSTTGSVSAGDMHATGIVTAEQLTSTDDITATDSVITATLEVGGAVLGDDCVSIAHSPVDDSYAHGLVVGGTPNATTTASYNNIGLNFNRGIGTESGISNTGYQAAVFGQLLGDANHEGTLDRLYGLDVGYGHTTGCTGTTTTIKGLRLRPNIVAGTMGTIYNIYMEAPEAGITPTAEYSIWDASGWDWVLDADSQKIFFGAGQDASIYYDGTDMYFNSREVGTGDFIFSGGNVGIGTTVPTNLLSLGGNSARTFWMERHTTADTAGNNLTVQAGGATSGATNKAGGDLYLASGTATGTGSSDIFLQGVTAGGSGTSDNSATTALTIRGNTSVVLGTAALATNATDGFLYIPSSAGTPTGTPTTETGRIPIQYDTTNNRLYAYRGGAWRYFAETGGFQIPDFETIDPISGGGIEEGDIVLGRVDESMSDGALHATWIKWDSLKEQLIQEIRESGNIIPEGSWMTGSPLDPKTKIKNVDTSTFLEKVTNVLNSLRVSIKDGVMKIREIVVERLTAKTARMEKLEMVDSATGAVYCTWIENGEWKKIQGECGSANPVEVQPSVTDEPEPEPPPAEPVTPAPVAPGGSNDILPSGSGDMFFQQAVAQIKKQIKYEIKQEMEDEQHETSDIAPAGAMSDVNADEEEVEPLPAQDKSPAEEVAPVTPEEPVMDLIPPIEEILEPVIDVVQEATAGLMSGAERFFASLLNGVKEIFSWLLKITSWQTASIMDYAKKLSSLYFRFLIR